MFFDATKFSTLPEALSYTAKQNLNKLAIQQASDGYLEQKISFAKLLELIQEQAQYFLHFGLRAGDRVALIEGNSTQDIITFFAILWVEATVVKIDPLLETSNYEKLLDLCDPQLIVTSESILSKIPALIQKKLNILNIYKNLELFSEKKPIPINRDGDPKIAFIMFTSGTNGVPLPVMLSHQSMLASVKIYHENKVPKNTHLLMMIPLTHIYGLATFSAFILKGFPTTFLTKLQPDLILKTIKVSKATFLCTVPRFIELFEAKLSKKIDNKHFFKGVIKLAGYIRNKTGWNIGKFLFVSIHRECGFRTFSSGGVSLNKEIHKRLNDLGFTIVQGYGLTETAAVVVGTTYQRPFHGSSGKPLKGVQLRIDPLAGLEGGEICIKSPSIMIGYFRNPQATAAAIRNGWLHTGDLGYLDNHGFLQITGRIKEVIVTSNGKKAMPQDIEDRYKNIPGIQEIAVVGLALTHDAHEEIYAAIVISEELIEQNLDQETLKEKIKEQINKRNDEVPGHLRIQNFQIISALPKTNTMKVKRNELREYLKNKIISEQNTIAFAHDTYDAITLEVLAIVKRVCELSGKPALHLHPSMSFQMDLKFDSLTSLECSFEIEQHFNIRIKQIENIKTIADLDQIIRSLLKENNKNVIKSASFHQELINEITLSEFENKLIAKKSSESQSLLFHSIHFIYKKFFQLEVFGKEHIPNSPFVLCSNHSSHLDVPALIFASGLPIADFGVFAAKDYFFDAGWRRSFFTKLFNLIPFSRGTKQSDISHNLTLAKKCIQNNKNLIIFPEGTRAINGELQDFKSFIGLLQYELEIPIIPAYIKGTYNCLPKGKKFPKKGKIYVTFGPPINNQSIKRHEQGSESLLYNTITNIVQENVSALAKRQE